MRFPCPTCGAAVDLPPGFDRPKIRCPDCGYYAAVPVELRGGGESSPPTPAVTAQPRAVPAARPRPAPAPVPAPPPVARPPADPRDTRPNFESDEPAGPPLLAGTRDESDDDAEVQPYAVPGTGTKACPHCRGELPFPATLCVHCGRDLATGAKTRDRTFQPINRTWDEGFPLKLRFQIFLAAQGLNVLFLLISLFAEGWAGVGVANLVAQVPLQAFVLGTFDALTVRRTAQGKTTLTRTRRVAFYPVPAAKIPWKKSQAVAVTAAAGGGVVAWLVCLYLFTLCVVPGVIFFVMVIRPERHAVRLCDVHGSTDVVAFTATAPDAADEIARTIHDATGLAYRPAV